MRRKSAVPQKPRICQKHQETQTTPKKPDLVETAQPWQPWPSPVYLRKKTFSLQINRTRLQWAIFANATSSGVERTKTAPGGLEARFMQSRRNYTVRPSGPTRYGGG